MENERLVETLVGLHEAGRVMGSTLDSAESGYRMLRILDRTLRPEASTIHLYDDEGELEVLTSLNMETLPDEVSPERVESARRHALAEGRRHSLRLGQELYGTFIPLRSGSGTIGILEVYGIPLEPSGEEFLSSLCAQAAIALDNSRLHGKLRENERRLQGLVDRMVRIQEDERRRVAHEIHDGLTQTIIAIRHHLQAFSRDYCPPEEEGAGRLERLEQLARGAADESQRITFGLRPTVLEDFGVAAAIRSEADSLDAQGFRVSYTDGLGERRLPEVVETTLYRIAQEALSNARRHAGVESAEVVTEVTEKGEAEVRMRISDHGAGFEPGALPQTGGLGLLGMRERAELIGGTLELDSRPGHGTRVIVAAPIPPVEGAGHG